MSATIADIRREQERHLDAADRCAQGSAEHRQHLAEFDRLQAVKEELQGKVRRQEPTRAVTAEQLLIAHHEAAHTAVAYMLGDTAVSASIVPTEHYRGVCIWSDGWFKSASGLNLATVYAAGWFGEQLAGVEKPEGWGYSAAKDDEDIARVYHDRRAACERAQGLVCSNGLAIRSLASLLIEKRTITAADVAGAFAQFPPQSW